MPDYLILSLFALLSFLTWLGVSKTKWKNNPSVFAVIVVFFIFVHNILFKQSSVSNNSAPLSGTPPEIDRFLHANDNIQPTISIYLPFFFSTIFGLVLTYFLLVIKSKYSLENNRSKTFFIIIFLSILLNMFLVSVMK